MDELFDGRSISHVAGHCLSLSPGRTNTVRNGVQSLPVACSEHHGGARLCKGKRSYLSNAPACTGNKSDLTGERWLNRVSSHDISPCITYYAATYRSLFFCAFARDRGQSNPVAIT